MANNQQSLITDSNFLWSWGKTHDPQKTQQMAKYDTALELWITGKKRKQHTQSPSLIYPGPWLASLENPFVCKYSYS